MNLGAATTAADGSLAAFPDWRLTITQGAATVTVGPVASSGVLAGLRKATRCLRQARRGGRGSMSFTLSNVPDPGTGARLSDTFTTAAPIEGATVQLRVICGAVDAVLWRGQVIEVAAVDHADLRLECAELVPWADVAPVQPITTDDWPLADPDELGEGAPLALGQVADMALPLVRRPPESVLTAALISTATTAQVASTAGFPASGPVRVGEESMTYAGLTPTSLTGLVRSSPTSHIAGEPVVELGELVFLASAGEVDSVTALRLDLGQGLTTTVPSSVGVTVDTGPPATVTLDAQPVVDAGVQDVTRVCLFDLDAVEHSDLPNAQAELCLGLADGFQALGHADLEAAGEGTGGSRTAAPATPAGVTPQRVFVVIEAEGHVDDALAIVNVDTAAAATSISTSDGAAFPASGSVWIGNGANSLGTPELVTYTGVSTDTLTGCTRGVNNGGVGFDQPEGAPISVGQATVHLDLAGGDASTGNAIGHLSPRPELTKEPEAIGCQLIPGTHGFSLQDHAHDVPSHLHEWDTSHEHPAGATIRVDPYAVAIKLGQGGTTGDPVVQGLSALTTGMVAPAITDATEITHTAVAGAPGGYDRTNWWAVMWPSEPFRFDTRRVLRLDYFVAVSGLGGGVKVVTAGDAVPPNNPTFPPLIHVASHPVLPPEALGLGLVDGMIAAGGLHGTWANESAMTPSSPANGGELTLKPQGSVDPFQVWGADAGADDRSSLPMAPRGYVRIEEGLTREWVRYDGCRWNATQDRLILENITRAAYESGTFPAASFTPEGGEVERFPTVGWFACRYAYSGQGQVTGSDGRTCAQLNANAGEVEVYQTELQPAFDAIEACYEPALFRPTMADLFTSRVAVTPGGNLVPFNPEETDIFLQWGGTVEAMAQSPIMWVRAHENLQVHAVWCEVTPEDTTSSEVADDGLTTAETATDESGAFRVSGLSWFEVTHLVDDIADLAGATIKVDRIDPTGFGLTYDTVRLLRLFVVVEGVTSQATNKARPQRLIADVNGPGASSARSGTELIEDLVEHGLGQTPATVLDAAAFAAASGSTHPMGAFLRDTKPSGLQIIERLAEQARLLTTWANDGKLTVSYLEDRASLPSPSATFTVDDVGLDSLQVRRGPVRDLVTRCTVLGRYTDSAAGPTLTGTAGVRGDPDRHLELAAPHLQDQAGVDSLAGHVVDYGLDVTVRPRFSTFTQAFAVLPGHLLELDHPEHSTTALLVELVELDFTAPAAAFATIEGRDLTT